MRVPALQQKKHTNSANFCVLGRYVHVMSPAAEIPHVLLVRTCAADADHDAGGPVTANAVTVTFCDAVNPWTEVAPDTVPLK